MKRFLVLCSFSVGLLLAFPSGFKIAHAAPPWLVHLPTAGPTSGLGLLHLIQNLTNWLFVGFMLLAVVVILLAGWQFITGGGAPESVSSARKKLLWAGVAVITALMSRGIPVVVASILGVGGGGGGPLPPLPPGVNLSTPHLTILVGDPVLLTWGTSSVTNCTASGDWTGVKSATGGTETIPSVTGLGTKTYTIDCTGTTGTVTDSVTVTVTNPAPIAHWKFNEMAGSTAADSVGGFNGTLQGGTSWVAGQVNGAIQCDAGALDDYVTMGNVLNMGTDDFSIGMWVRNLTQGGIIGKWRDTGLAGYYIRYDPLNGIQVFISNGLDNSARGITVGNGNTAPADGNWHHVIVVVRNSTDIALYIDGILDNADGGSLAIEPGNIDNAQDFSLCRKNLDSNPMPTHDYMEGILDDVKIWKTVLTPAQVAAEFNAGP